MEIQSALEVSELAELHKETKTYEDQGRTGFGNLVTVLFVPAVTFHDRCVLSRLDPFHPCNSDTSYTTMPIPKPHLIGPTKSQQSPGNGCTIGR